MINFLKNLNQANEPLVLKTVGEAVVKGEALQYNAQGKLVKATTAPKYISVKAGASNEKINVATIRKEDLFEVEVSSTDGLVEGTIVDIDSDATSIATTTTNPVFLIEKILEDRVIGRFV
jgi:hypothetical protein